VVHLANFVNGRVRLGSYQFGIFATMFDEMNDETSYAERELEEEGLPC
jgi:hypothetical protein